MPTVERSALVNYSAKQMFDLVNDVAAYPEFLPGCVASKIIEQSDVLMVAEMALKKGPVSQTFTTRNVLVAPAQIKMQLEQGPFDYLTGVWNFTALTESACKVELQLDFKFSSGLVAVAFSRLFSELTLKMVDSFVSRADVIYLG